MSLYSDLVVTEWRQMRKRNYVVSMMYEYVPWGTRRDKRVRIWAAGSVGENEVHFSEKALKAYQIYAKNFN